jgi:hypothetical protein
MYLTPFVCLFPEQAKAETRVITTRGYPVPDDEYALCEAYCTDPTCDCRRVMIAVLPHRQMEQGYLAYIGFGFDRDSKYAGPYLDPLNRQSRYAPVLLDLVAQVLADPAYVARLESHYRQVKQAVADPTHPVHQVLARIALDDEDRLVRRGRKKRRKNDN